MRRLKVDYIEFRHTERRSPSWYTANDPANDAEIALMDLAIENREFDRMSSSAWERLVENTGRIAAALKKQGREYSVQGISDCLVCANARCKRYKDISKHIRTDTKKQRQHYKHVVGGGKMVP